eukprot:NODE_1408_length_931_cov_161.914966_g1086_i0.p1 GENE.NODE_1408_length_931_cov_161.914966_g1086_i0~~NODE_1408_length_931_cov_161.914966_g1086_i0.p1  ORF type:complete len:226 (-),score=43.29 NODE_1408_length_931_cov_161.914966_g1086_i0:182-859(-)
MSQQQQWEGLTKTVDGPGCGRKRLMGSRARPQDTFSTSHDAGGAEDRAPAGIPSTYKSVERRYKSTPCDSGAILHHTPAKGTQEERAVGSRFEASAKFEERNAGKSAAPKGLRSGYSPTPGAAGASAPPSPPSRRIVQRTPATGNVIYGPPPSTPGATGQRFANRPQTHANPTRPSLNPENPPPNQPQRHRATMPPNALRLDHTPSHELTRFHDSTKGATSNLIQ